MAYTRLMPSSNSDARKRHEEAAFGAPDSTRAPSFDVRLAVKARSAERRLDLEKKIVSAAREMVESDLENCAPNTAPRAALARAVSYLTDALGALDRYSDSLKVAQP